MAKATIGGETYELRPLKLRELRLAAPAMDRLNARLQDQRHTLEGTMDSAFDILTVLALAIEADVTAESLEAEASIEDLTGLWSSLADLQAESGMTAKGEREPGVKPAKKAARSPSKSSASS